MDRACSLLRCVHGVGWETDKSSLPGLLHNHDVQNPIKYALLTLLDLTYVNIPTYCGITSFLSALEPAKVLPHSGSLPRTLLLSRVLSLSSLLDCPFLSLRSLLTHHFPSEVFPDHPQPTLIPPIHHTLLSKISLLFLN